MHTPLCKHACGKPIEYVRRAHEIGLKVIGFSDHCPAPANFDTECRMDLSQIERYIEIIEEVKNNPYGIEVLCGMEIDYVPGKMDEVASLIDSYDFDYIIGSIHHVDDYPFDNPQYIDKWSTPEKIEYIWNKYANLLKDMVASFKLDIIGHIDLPKKFGMLPRNMDFFRSKISEVVQIASDKGVLIEINTAGKRKPVKEFYPSLDIMQLIKLNGGSITFGSDSHSPDEVGSDFDTASSLAINAGFKDYTVIGKSGKRHKEKLSYI